MFSYKKYTKVIIDNVDDENFTIPYLCRALTMSRSQLHNKLKALTGKSTSIYVRSIRLNKAKELLLSTDLTISEIAYEVGFKDSNYFSRCFNEEYGHTPTHVRNQ